jgi:hypothetical protein
VRRFVPVIMITALAAASACSSSGGSIPSAQSQFPLPSASAGPATIRDFCNLFVDQIAAGNTKDSYAEIGDVMKRATPGVGGPMTAADWADIVQKDAPYAGATHEHLVAVDSLEGDRWSCHFLQNDPAVNSEAVIRVSGTSIKPKLADLEVTSFYVQSRENPSATPSS